MQSPNAKKLGWYKSLWLTLYGLVEWDVLARNRILVVLSIPGLTPGSPLMHGKALDCNGQEQGNVNIAFEAQ